MLALAIQLLSLIRLRILTLSRTEVEPQSSMMTASTADSSLCSDFLTSYPSGNGVPSVRPSSSSRRLTSRSDVRPKLRTDGRSWSVLLTSSPDGLDPGGIEAVAGTDREVQFVGPHVELPDQFVVHGRGRGGLFGDPLVSQFEVLDEGMRCFRRILDDSTMAISGEMVPSVQRSRIGRS